jgi:hypothetical protein
VAADVAVGREHGASVSLDGRASTRTIVLFPNWPSDRDQPELVRSERTVFSVRRDDPALGAQVTNATVDLLDGREGLAKLSLGERASGPDVRDEP